LANFINSAALQENFGPVKFKNAKYALKSAKIKQKNLSFKRGERFLDWNDFRFAKTCRLNRQLKYLCQSWIKTKNKL
jgi:hypothetical protein